MLEKRHQSLLTLQYDFDEHAERLCIGIPLGRETQAIAKEDEYHKYLTNATLHCNIKKFMISW